MLRSGKLLPKNQLNLSPLQEMVLISCCERFKDLLKRLVIEREAIRSNVWVSAYYLSLLEGGD